MSLNRQFFLCGAVELAQKLLGLELVHKSPEGETGGLIVEAEAYCGKTDPAAHSYKGPPDGRTAVMYGLGGHAYIYLIYGMHECFNIVAGPQGDPQGVLIRALEPRTGVALMSARRGGVPLRQLTNGPGKLTRAMGITRADYGADLLGSRIFLRRADCAPFEITAASRINVDYAGAAAQYPWRFTMGGSPFVSKPAK